MDTYSETWGKVVNLVFIKKYIFQGEIIYSMHPDFENIEFAELEEEEPVTGKHETLYTEEHHFEGVSESIRNLYLELKDHILSVNPKIAFNPQKYYISIRLERNIAFFIIGRKKIRLVVLQNDIETRNEIKYHTVKTLTASVQKFWNRPSCAVILDSNHEIEEIKRLLSKLI